MLPITQVACYARNFARKRNIADIEEAEAVAISSIARAQKKAPDASERYYIKFARLAMLQHFYNKKSPCSLPDGFDVEAPCRDQLGEIMEGMKLTPGQEKLITYRLAGYTDSEIGNITKVSQQAIQKQRSILRKRFNDLQFLYQ